jgi:hypothetical protein
MRAFISTLAVAGIVSSISCAVRAADAVPNFEIVKVCKSEAEDNAGTGESLSSCINDENQAKTELTERWSRYAQEDKTNCTRETNIAGLPSYVELEICLEMANDTRLPANKGARLPAKEKP